MRAFIQRYPVLTFVVLTLGFQFLIVLLVKATSNSGENVLEDPTAHGIFRLRVFGPLIFAALLSWYLEGKAGLANLFGSFLKWRVPAKWYMLAFTWKFVLTYLGCTVLLLFGIREWVGWIKEDFFVGPGTSMEDAAELTLMEWFRYHVFSGEQTGLKDLRDNMLFLVGVAFVEETSWMKFCVTRLQERFTAFRSCLTIGICWGFWYSPMVIMGEGVPDGYLWPMHLMSMISLTFLLGWIFNMTRSGAVLMVAQVVANTTFFIIPALPGYWDGDTAYVNSFVFFNISMAVTLVLIYGPKELSRRKRARWSEGLGPTGEGEGTAQAAISPTV
ncbi:MAG: hypothetical protein JNM31_15965 [Flavobacteriales bacterium]|nr:hypothetical protein [Flavobacteriales bacterium]